MTEQKVPYVSIRVKIGRPIGMTAKCLDRLLWASRRGCRVARNVALGHWLLWRQSHPEWKPGDAYTPRPAKIRPKPSRGDGPPRPVAESPVMPRHFDREMRDAAAALVPSLAASLIAGCVREVCKELHAGMPWNHDGVARFRWQAILSGEAIPASRERRGFVAVPKREATLGYEGFICGACGAGRPQVIRELSRSGCVLTFPLLSRVSGFRNKSPVVGLEVGKLPEDRRRIIRRMVRGELTLGDSQIVRANGHWELHLACEAPAVVAQGDPRRKLFIRPSAPDARYPFTATWESLDGEDREWGLGNGVALEAEYRRLAARRRAIEVLGRSRLKSSHGARKWRGLRSCVSRSQGNLLIRFRRQLAADLARLAVREGIGHVIYLEPSLVVRKHDWFSERSIPMEWTQLSQMFKAKVERSGLKFERSRLGMKRWMAMNGKDESVAVG